jgi:transcription initiation factor TFIID TATA-box-binding protein
MYEPSQFPGLIIRMADPKVVCLVFTSGKVVCTGAKNEDMVDEAVVKLHRTLEDYALFF